MVELFFFAHNSCDKYFNSTKQFTMLPYKQEGSLTCFLRFLYIWSMCKQFFLLQTGLWTIYFKYLFVYFYLWQILWHLTPHHMSVNHYGISKVAVFTTNSEVCHNLWSVYQGVCNYAQVVEIARGVSVIDGATPLHVFVFSKVLKE